MKALTRSFLIIAFFLSFFLGQTFTAGAEVKDLGEVCFNMSPEIVFEGVEEQLQVGVLSFGSGHFMLDGKIVRLMTLASLGRVHGSAFIDGNSITMNFTLSDVTSMISPRSGTVSFFHIILDAATLSGSWVSLEFPFVSPTTSPVVPRIGAGVISIAQCKQ